MTTIDGIISCEESQEVTMAFRELGHDFFSCDLQDCSGGHPEWHYKEDIFHVLRRDPLRYKFIGAHPPCTYLTNSGVRWLASTKPLPGYEWVPSRNIFINTDRWKKMVEAALFFKRLYLHIQDAGFGYLENPIMHKYAMKIIGIRPTQIIQPWQYGHGETKATCLWLVNLPELQPTEIVSGRDQNIWRETGWQPAHQRTKLRSKTFPGIAKAMAQQWSEYIISKQKAA